MNGELLNFASTVFWRPVILLVNEKSGSARALRPVGVLVDSGIDLPLVTMFPESLPFVAVIASPSLPFVLDDKLFRPLAIAPPNDRR